jgi:hypothetical protein
VEDAGAPISYIVLAEHTPVYSSYERAVALKLSAADAQHMPEPTPSPAVMEPTPDDIAGDTTEDTIAFALKRARDRISGNY